MSNYDELFDELDSLIWQLRAKWAEARDKPDPRMYPLDDRRACVDRRVRDYKWPLADITHLAECGILRRNSWGRRKGDRERAGIRFRKALEEATR